MKPKRVVQMFYYPLFKHMADNHGLILLDSEMVDICHVVLKMFKKRRKRP